MSTWLKDNKSIATIIIAGSLVFLGLVVYGVMKQLEEGKIHQQFVQTKNNIQTASAAALTPTEEIAEERLANTEDYEKLLSEIADTYSSFRPEASDLQEITPEEFRLTLNSTIDSFRKLATERNVKVPGDFRMGFDAYASVPALRQATGVLRYELNAINWLLEQAVNSDAAEVVRIYRERHPLETAAAEEPANPTGRGARTAAPAPRNTAGRELYQKLPLSVTLRGRRSTVVKLINEIITSEKYLFTIEGLRTLNEKNGALTVTPPAASRAATPGRTSRTNPSAARTGAAGQEPAAPAVEEIVTPVVGTELIDIHLVLDLILFPAKEGAPEEPSAPEEAATEAI